MNRVLGLKKQVNSFARSSGVAKTGLRRRQWGVWGGVSGETGKDPHLGVLSLQSPALCEQGIVFTLESGNRTPAARRFLGKAQTDPGSKRREWAHRHWDSS